MGMTDEELAAIKQRAEKAVPPANVLPGVELDGVYFDYHASDGEKAFLRHAREDVLALLAEIERLQWLYDDLADAEFSTWQPRRPSPT